MAFPGISYSALQISKKGIIISTMPFNIVVEKSVYSNKEMESQHESDVFRDMIIHIEDHDNPHQTTKEQVGLGNVDDTSDIDKPVSTAQQNALDEKVDKTAVATSSALGLVKSGTDITVDENGNVSVNDNSHNHMASNISDLPEFTQDAISIHNTSSTAHNDIRELISILTTRLNALADSDDTTLDQLSEIVAYIKSNRSLIENVTTNKVNVSDIIDNLTSTNTNKPLSANQGKILNDLITALETASENKVDKVPGKGLSANDYTTEEKEKLNSISSGAAVNVQSDWNETDTNSDSYIKNKPTIPIKTSQLENDSGFTDNFSLSVATASVRGGVKIGYTANGKNYPVQLSDEQMYVNVPWTDTNTTIVNNLTSTSTTSALSAYQGNVLNTAIAGKAASSHTHSYLPLSGGTVTGAIAVNNNLSATHLYTHMASGQNNTSYHCVVTTPSETAICDSIYTGTNTVFFNAKWGTTTSSNRSLTVTSSDIRLKENVEYSKVIALDIIMQMKMRQFDWKENGGHQDLGFIADELEKIDSRFAVGGGCDEDGIMNVKSVDTFYMMGYVVKGMQELYGEIQLLKEENRELKKQLNF